MTAVPPIPRAAGFDHDLVLIQPYSAPDSLGRQTFMAHWWDTNVGPHCDQSGVRGQVFHERVDEHAARWREKGYRVEVEPYGDAAGSDR